MGNHSEGLRQDICGRYEIFFCHESFDPSFIQNWKDRDLSQD
jgi:hypothetical protein